MLSSSLTSLAGEWRTLLTGVRDVWNLVTRRAPPTAAGGAGMVWLLLLIAVSIVSVVWVAHAALGLGVVRVLLALLVSAALAVVRPGRRKKLFH